MNTTLTGLGIALVVALVAALIGPFFIDWNDHRAAFEAQASRLVGVPVRVLGEVEARLLPSPRIRFRDVVAGDEWAASKFTADSFELDIALMPLLAGDYQVTSLRVDGADLKASLSADGEVALPIAPRGISRADLETIAIADLEIRRSRITLADPAANRNFVIENFGLHGAASSLAGPLKFEARGKIGEDTYALRVATGRFDKDGVGRVTLTLDGPPSLTLDGSLLLAAKPRFEGTAALIQTAAAEGEPPREPWKIAGAITADMRTLEAGKVDFEYGPADRQLRLGGGLALTFGPKPSADIRLTGRRIDLDRAIGLPKDAPPLPPAEVLKRLAERLPLDAAMPVRLTADVENISLGGDVVQNLRAALVSEPGGWTVEALSARLPGDTDFDVSGALMVRDGEGPRFNGPVKLDAPNMPLLVHWLEGLGGDRPSIALKDLELKASVVARPGSYALEDMTASADGADIEGRFAFTHAAQGRNKLEARLTAESLDLDALGPRRLLQAADASGRGMDVELALRAKELTYAKVVWQGVDVDLSASAGAVDIRRLTIADLGGARIAATGSLAEKNGRPSGRLEAKIEADNLNGLVTVLRTSALPPALVDAIGARAGVIAPASLTAVLASAGDGAEGATVKVAGSLGGTALELEASAPDFALSGPIKARLTASSADGARLFAQLGLPAVAIESFGPASLEATLDGDPAKGADVEIGLTADADRLSFRGKADDRQGRLFAGRVDATIGDAARYAVLLGRVPPASLPTIPLTFGGDVSYGDEGWRIARLAGLVDDRAFKGDLAYGEKGGLRGEIEVASLSVSELAGAALGPLALSQSNEAGWPTGVVGPGLFEGIEGRVTVRTDSFGIAPGYTGGETRFDLVLSRNELSIQEAETALAGGRLKGNFAVRRASEELSVAARLAPEDIALGDVVWHGQGRPAATGTLDLTADMLGTGKTLAAVVSNLAGSGSFTLRDTKLSGIDAGAFERTLIAVEGDSEPPDAAEIGRRFTGELAMGDLEVTEMSSAFTIASGVVRISNAAVTSPLVNATASGSVDLSNKVFDARMTLRPKILSDIEDNSIPAAELIVAGPWGAPARSTETTAFANVLAVRAVEREIARVEKLEAERREQARRAAEEEARRAEEEARRKAEEAEAARLKAIREATGDIPLGALPPPVEILPRRAPPSSPAVSSESQAPSPSPRRQSPLDFLLRRPAVPEASR